MNSIELFDIITLEDNKDYTVACSVNYQNNEYLYLVEVDKDENPIENNQKIVRRVISDGEDSVEIVTDQKEIEEVGKLFYEVLQQMAQDEE